MNKLKPSIPRHPPHAKIRGVFEKIAFVFSLSFPNSKRKENYTLVRIDGQEGFGLEDSEQITILSEIEGAEEQKKGGP
jgi:hypothetical protein